MLQSGSDVTIVGFQNGLTHCMQAAEQLAQQGVSCEVINLRSIRPLDRKTIVDSVKKTNRLVTVEEGWP